TGAFDIVLGNAASELQIMESAGATFYGTFDVGDLSANRTYTFPNAAGTVITTGNLTDITTVGTVTVGTWNGTAITDAYVDNSITIANAGTVDWEALSNYPAACSAGQAITQLGDTITCSAFASSDTTYTAGNDLDLSGTTFNIESQLDFVSTVSYGGLFTL